MHTSAAQLIESIGDPCLVVSVDGLRVVVSNAAAEQLFGVPSHSLAGSPLSERCAAGEADSILPLLTNNHGASHSFTAHQKRSDGSVFAARVTAAPCETHEGPAITMLIRECREEVDRARAHSKLQDVLLDNTSDGVVAHTLDGELLYANEAALKTWGGTFAEIRARGPFGWTPDESRHLIGERIAMLLEEGESRFESVSRNGHGEVHSEVHARLVHTDEGSIIISTSRDISERIQTEEMVRYLAYHDTLTGLANRVRLEQQLSHEIISSERHGDVLGVIFIDLDKFKPVNDTYGHTIGDHVLREVADRLVGAVRESDLVARLGGDEFVVVLPRLDSICAINTVADKLAAEVGKPIRIGRIEVSVSATMGVAIHQRGEDADSLIIRADLAMYEARDQQIPDCDALWT